MSGVWSDGKECNWAMCLLLQQGSLHIFTQHLDKLPIVRVETHKAFWGLGSELHTVSLADSIGQSKSQSLPRLRKMKYTPHFCWEELQRLWLQGGVKNCCPFVQSTYAEHKAWVAQNWSLAYLSTWSIRWQLDGRSSPWTWAGGDQEQMVVVSRAHDCREKKMKRDPNWNSIVGTKLSGPLISVTFKSARREVRNSPR